MSRGSILVVEDDAPIRRGLVDALTFAGFSVTERGDGPSGLAAAIESAPDLVLLDVLLPALSGFDVLRELRKARPTLPVIMVTARGSESDRVRGLQDGADDYVVKPFSARELLARVEAVLRRSPERPDRVRRLRAGSIEIDLDRREVCMAGEAVTRQLSDRESQILGYLAANRGRAVDRDELLHRVWGLNPRGLHTRTVDMHIARLREKLSPDAGSVIVTVRAKGYMLADGVAIEPRDEEEPGPVGA
jgi:DNA-binding response OmpR family regulator